MEQNNTPEQPVQQPHPTLVIINKFLSDCLTENEYFARCSAVLQMVHPEVIKEAARQLSAQETAQNDQPAE